MLGAATSTQLGVNGKGNKRLSNSMIESIKRLEERLRKAMISSNVDELDILLSPELI